MDREGGANGWERGGKNRGNKGRESEVECVCVCVREREKEGA